MTPPRIRVLVVDDSAFARKVVRETLAAHDRIEVVGLARDGLEALERIAELKPDVVTLDLVMPNLDGVGVLKALTPGSPRVVVVSMADGGSELGIAALRAGAIDIVHKPTSLATDRLYELAGELVAKVLAAADARMVPLVDAPPTAPIAVPSSLSTSRRVLVIGASTGGPQALTRLLRELPANFPVPIALVLHMPPGYTAAFAERLDEESALHVVEATDGLRLRPGMAAVARAGLHLKLQRDAEGFRARLDTQPLGRLHTPSVDALFHSVAEAGSQVLAVVLTGMGDDGVSGARAIRGHGGAVLTEAESSCVVYGMPRSIVEAGLSTESAPIERMSETILRHL